MSSENYKMKNSCPLWDSNSRHSAYEAELRGLMSAEWIKVHLILTVLFLEIYLQHMLDVAQ